MRDDIVAFKWMSNYKKSNLKDLWIYKKCILRLATLSP